MNLLKSSVIRSSLVALGLTAVALLLSLVLDSYFESDAFPLFLIAVWLSTWYHGRMGGLTATLASGVSILYFFLQPDAVTLPSFTTMSRLFAFVALASLIAWVTASWRESRRLLAATLASIADAVLATDREGNITFLNSVAETLTGWSRVDAKSKPASEVLRLLDEKTCDPIEDPLARAMRDRIRVATDDHTILVSRSGTEVPIEHTASPLRDDAGIIWGAILVFRDISKRRQLEEHATHSQKMEAVGRLAGGVAGDFNNVLTVITGYADLLRSEVPATSPLRKSVDEIIYAGDRAAALTGHLLAFSRGSTSQARVLDLNSLISGMEAMLRRVLGQNVELIVLPSPDLGRVKADPSLMEQVIVNLANNSRDAMPNGGKFVIETANVELEDNPGAKNRGVKPGTYVMLAVSDTGVGMNAETRSRLFEPFFTTKAPGKGSGLGLATVYGTIKQSDGEVTVYSQPNCGTIFEIYLPLVKDAISEQPSKRSPKGSETVLLVDDEDGVRKLLAAILRSNGYDVLEANNGRAALTAYEKNAHKIDLVVTDIVMPQMSGFELAQQLGERSPALKILYISGYRDNALGEAGSPPRAFLHKPFTPDTLLSKVRDVLDAEKV